MKDIYDLVESLDVFRMSNEDLYKLSDLEKVLEDLNGEELKSPDCIIVPYYVDVGKRLELYVYELNIKNTDKNGFEEHLLELTGRTEVDSIPADIIRRQEVCYIEILGEEGVLDKEKIQNYINYLYSFQDIQQEVKSSFGNFEKEKLFFEIY